jgi:hypothetical protein
VAKSKAFCVNVLRAEDWGSDHLQRRAGGETFKSRDWAPATGSPVQSTRWSPSTAAW